MKSTKAAIDRAGMDAFTQRFFSDMFLESGDPALRERLIARAQGLNARFGQGDVVVIPGGTEHEAWFLEDTEVIDFFAPPRDDFLVGGKPVYMSEG